MRLKIAHELHRTRKKNPIDTIYFYVRSIEYIPVLHVFLLTDSVCDSGFVFKYVSHII